MAWRLTTSELTSLRGDVNGLIDESFVFIEDFFDETSAVNAAPAIIAALTSLQENQTLSSYTKTINLTDVVSYDFTSLQIGCTIKLNSTFITTNDNGFKLEGLGIKLNSISIGRVAYKSLSISDVAGPDVSVGVGVELRNFWNTDCDIQGPVNFMTPVKAVGGGFATSGNGMAFTNIRVRYPKAPKLVGAVCLECTTEPFETTPGYFNSNNLSVEFMRGQNGIKFTKGSLQTDRFNGNKIIDSSIEDTVDIGIDLEFSTGNLIDAPRFEGGHVPTVWVQDDSDSSRNKVNVLGSPDTTKFNLLGNGSEIVGTATDETGVNIYSQTLIGPDESDVTGNDQTIYLANRRGTSTKNNTVCFGGIPGQNRWSKFAGVIIDMLGNQKLFGLLDPVGYFKATNVEGVVQVPSGVSELEISTTGVSEVFLRMSADREINGYSLLMDLTFYTQLISVQKSSGTEVIDNAIITQTGLYMLVYKADVWNVSRIGDKLAR